MVDALRPASADDWLIVAGDIGERFSDVERTLRSLRSRFAAVIWAPGNHELWTLPDDPVQLRGQARYRALVELCRTLDVATPEDPYPVWRGPGGPVTVAPLFLLYDYSFRPPGTRTAQEALAAAHAAGVVCTDELLLHPDPYPSRADWCAARLAETERLLAARDPALPTVLVNHFPLRREPTEILRHPEFAQWCGTERTRDWHRRFNAAAVVYGHLHIPRDLSTDGVPFLEVSLGYPREWQPRGAAPAPRRILPATAPPASPLPPGHPLSTLPAPGRPPTVRPPAARPAAVRQPWPVRV
ncbi:metallophosphoesterase [Kitasatospora nipponensis]|uniref:Metallophosphoesterase n=1 Tax=Kitasatospora nipponensis TaxID=258049 RepID=A0ABN1T7W1_9ACTN